MTYVEQILEYAEARRESLMHYLNRTSGDHPYSDGALEELRRMIVLCDGLIQQEKLIKSALCIETKNQ